MKRLPAASAARLTCSRIHRSPLGSTTTAASPCAIARVAIHVWVTVLPEPVAPATSVWVPPLPPEAPPSSIETARPRRSVPTVSCSPRNHCSLRSRPRGAAQRVAHRAHSAAAQPADGPLCSHERTARAPPRSPSSGVVRPAAISARSAPACRSSPCQRRPRTAAPSAATPSVAAEPASTARASRTSANAPAAQLQWRCRWRITRAASRPRSTPRATWTVAPTSHCTRCSSGASGSVSRLRVASCDEDMGSPPFT